MSSDRSNLSDISDQYEALFVDLWGCVHNGVEAYPAANEALIAYRKRGGKVVLGHQFTAPAQLGGRANQRIWRVRPRVG